MSAVPFEAPKFGAAFWSTRLVSFIVAIGFCFALDAASGQLTIFYQRLVMLAGLYVTLAVSLNMINGITGQFSIGHAAFYQVGAYSAAYVSVSFFKAQPLTAHAWYILMCVVGAIGAGFAGIVVGLPSLRLKGDYLAVATLGFGEIIRIVTQNVKEIGAASGMNVIPAAGQKGLVWLSWLLAVLCIAISRNLLKNVHGLPFLAIREDEVASSAMGVNVTRTKVVAFILGSAFAGAAGAIYAFMEGFILPSQFSMEVSFIILTMVVLGGSGSITGTLLAAIVLSALPELLRLIKVVPMAGVVGGILATCFTVAGIMRIVQRVHDKRKIGYILGAMGAGLVVGFILKALFSMVPGIREATTDGNRLRMVIFAGTLIILMLLRPQGIFGHHEFSWDWLRRVLRRSKA